MKIPKLTLVGAGPGDPELITLKGLKAIQKADAILYDSLASKELLEYAPKSCKLLYVGKRHGCKSSKQEAIHDLIVHCAKKYGNVIRLKGGDPFVFGRGYEELQFAIQHGLSVEVIPGISSCISVPASAGIPITHRGFSEGFWVTTGTLKTGEISSDIYLAAKSNSTVVILMGLHKIAAIADIFIKEGKGATPVAVIQNGSLPESKVVAGNLADIADLVFNKGLKSPAIIVIGEVAKLTPAYLAEMSTLAESESRVDF
ncbi:MAG: uroporphyrinogen-III C-methyltransferase [Opitutaceae bacterium]|nr:uroporphyrinogen-III C-methyltransferase [Cytophagales bacterium]